MMNPMIGRWNGVDALAPIFPENSPYSYVLNDPINLTDPDGKAPRNPFWRKVKEGVQRVLDIFRPRKNRKSSAARCNPKNINAAHKPSKAKGKGSGGRNRQSKTVTEIVTVWETTYSWDSRENSTLDYNVDYGIQIPQITINIPDEPEELNNDEAKVMFLTLPPLYFEGVDKFHTVVFRKDGNIGALYIGSAPPGASDINEKLQANFGDMIVITPIIRNTERARMEAGESVDLLSRISNVRLKAVVREPKRYLVTYRKILFFFRKEISRRKIE
jgi:hypothetical protein